MILKIIFACAIFQQAYSHGWMRDPVSRSSAWRIGFPTPKNYNDMGLYCGGFNTRMGYGDKCGICGDPWVSENAIRDNEAGGKYATGTIVYTYNMGVEFNITIILTANHFGWMEFRICPNNDVKKRVTKECLDQHVLQRADGTGPKTMINDRRTGQWIMAYKLPKGMTCTQCVIQWKYHAGNSWGVDRDTGKSCLGCGDQEEFYGCADVAINGSDQAPQTTTPKPTPRPTQPPVVYTQPPPVVTQGPRVQTTTQPPLTTPKEFIGMKMSCKGIHNWANDPNLDKWCTDNCAIGNCPVYACDCSGSQQLVTDKPTTTQRPTTPKPTTTSTTPTTTSTTPTTTSTTSTTTTTTPTTTTTTPRPKTSTGHVITDKPNQQIVNRVECKAVNNWAGNSYFDRVCADSCARGNCPPESCKCDLVQKVITQSTTTTLLPETTKPVTHVRKVCRAKGSFAGNDVFDIWCTNECNRGVCPKANCECTEAVVQPTTTTTTTTRKPDVTSLGKCVSSGSVGSGDYWDTWCQQSCDRGACESVYCRCGL
ncbi:mucin-2-like isoform X2 [Ruditapes philippinarum]|uniref:mucin-2-like isoform X2 n=1 Tax=Ruditapes philippinarum TaxID=129788 RepID=UPI00295A9C3A|nr:mucin-2-like isoform X2 [Ruditapes philippinarum]